MTTETDTPPNSVYPPQEVIDAIESKWIERVKQLRLQNPRITTSGKRYQDDEREFFVGAMTAIITLEPKYKLPVKWSLYLLSGRPIVDAERHA